MPNYPITIHHLYTSPGHNYFGHAAGQPGHHPTLAHDAVMVQAGQGLVGDRFFGKGANFDGHVTFFAWEILQLLYQAPEVLPGLPASLRRNVILSGVPLNGLIGQEFAIDGVQFYGAKHCAPCRWLDEMVLPGARQILRGRGGLRAQALSDGILRRGPAMLYTAAPLDLTAITAPLPVPKLPG